jgi:hypothetical protein
LIRNSPRTGAQARFEPLAAYKFALQLARMFAKFIEETPVEEVHEATSYLAKPSDPAARQVIIDGWRRRFEKGGLRRRKGT